MKSVAIIPARGGSKRIPGKNIKDFLGRPMISYPIEAAIRSNCFSRIIVSTDDPEIARISEGFGAETMTRSAENSGDFSTTADVLVETIENFGKAPLHCCCIYPCSPMLTAEQLTKAFDKLTQGRYDTVVPVVPFDYPVDRRLKIDGDSIAFDLDTVSQKRSQDLTEFVHDAGTFYWFQTERFLSARTLFTGNTGFIMLSPLETQDIDTMADWKLAELKFRLKNESGE